MLLEITLKKIIPWLLPLTFLLSSSSDAGFRPSTLQGFLPSASDGLYARPRQQQLTPDQLQQLLRAHGTVLPRETIDRLRDAGRAGRERKETRGKTRAVLAQKLMEKTRLHEK